MNHLINQNRSTGVLVLSNYGKVYPHHYLSYILRDVQVRQYTNPSDMIPRNSYFFNVAGLYPALLAL